MNSRDFLRSFSIALLTPDPCLLLVQSQSVTELIAHRWCLVSDKNITWEKREEQKRGF